jgi:hypothetical protein
VPIGHPRTRSSPAMTRAARDGRSATVMPWEGVFEGHKWLLERTGSVIGRGHHNDKTKARRTENPLIVGTGGLEERISVEFSGPPHITVLATPSLCLFWGQFRRRRLLNPRLRHDLAAMPAPTLHIHLTDLHQVLCRQLQAISADIDAARSVAQAKPGLLNPLVGDPVSKPCRATTRSTRRWRW